MPISPACQLASELIRIPSESAAPTATVAAAPELAAAERLRDHLAGHGIAARLDEVQPGRWNLAARLPRPGAPRLLIAGHLDTVSALGMERPFAADLDHGFLRGRGACDDKGPLAAAAVALAALHAEGRRPAWDVTLLATCDEEAGMAGARAWAAAGADQDLIIDLEPTAMRPVTAHKGVYRCALATAGRACHSAQPEHGVNAITGMLAALAAVAGLADELARRHDPDLGRPTMTLTGIAGGTAINLVPEACSAHFDIRLTPDCTPSWVADRVRELAGPQVQVAEIFSAPALRRVRPDHGLDQRLARTLERHGLPATEATAAWCSDASFLQARGPCLVWGPGRIEDAHTREERIALQDLDQSVEVLRDFLID